MWISPGRGNRTDFAGALGWNKRDQVRVGGRQEEITGRDNWVFGGQCRSLV